MLVLLLLLCLQSIVLSSAECACELEERPDLTAKAETARWMVHSLNWGVVSTISSRLGGEGSPAIPFGNVYSFVDGPCDKSTGVPYLYGTYMDQSFSDTESNDMISLTLSESTLASVCPNEVLDSCALGPSGDPENPMCARLTLTGKFVALEDDSEEYEFAKNAFFERHPSMAYWPTGHAWLIAKIVIQDVWLIDFFGGATILDPEDYFSAGSYGDDTIE
mmetsp:Transcript_3005/g.7091  ORF Transcript_3005/g.7091 Transcript_3005/m.7091 type:complete len:220 (+) Transcript_3005:155-814(+)|eukprot:CAMPEP_0116083332 /NCGR_PEP_ID=MMETSP0327-20121206/3215_1 /TAXON_ID=44447 /ORGANISM="Pseudo-nitzschia delicatissima, Strain B596" /LENGTH=219 /DNA_ID=CAMNT_0003574209 /DNA_START=143 /DNA_END=802 /DNA_ORIENTATION=-